MLLAIHKVNKEIKNKSKCAEFSAGSVNNELRRAKRARLKKIILMVGLILSCMVMASCGGSQNVVKKLSTVENAVGKLTIYAYDGKSQSNNGLINLGHAFLGYENLSEESVMIGKYEVQPGEHITFSAWSMTAHSGLWYNLENNYINKYNYYDMRVSLTRTVDGEQLKNLNAAIAENDTWNPIQNCSYFSTQVWNSIADESESISAGLIPTPSSITEGIKLFDSYVTSIEMPDNEKTGFFKGGEFVGCVVNDRD